LLQQRQGWAIDSFLYRQLPEVDLGYLDEALVRLLQFQSFDPAAEKIRVLQCLALHIWHNRSSHLSRCAVEDSLHHSFAGRTTLRFVSNFLVCVTC
jgi:hypothetical protein